MRLKTSKGKKVAYLRKKVSTIEKMIQLNQEKYFLLYKNKNNSGQAKVANVLTQ